MAPQPGPNAGNCPPPPPPILLPPLIAPHGLTTFFGASRFVCVCALPSSSLAAWCRYLQLLGEASCFLFIVFMSPREGWFFEGWRAFSPLPPPCFNINSQENARTLSTPPSSNVPPPPPTNRPSSNFVLVVANFERMELNVDRNLERIL
jgi:hypothetical protein